MSTESSSVCLTCEHCGDSWRPFEVYVDGMNRALCSECGEVLMSVIPDWDMFYWDLAENSNVSVLVVVHSLHACGAVRSAIEMCEAFEANGESVLLLSLNGGGHWFSKCRSSASALAVAFGGKVDYQRLFPGGSSGLRLAVAHHLPAIEWLSTGAPRIADSVAAFHTQPHVFSESAVVLKHALEACTRFLFPTRELEGAYRDLAVRLGVSERPIEAGGLILRNAPPERRIECREGEGDYVAVVMRVDDDKVHWRDFVNAIDGVRAVLPNVPIRVAGFGEKLAEWRRKTEALCGVRLEGHVDDIDVFYQAARLVVVPSYTEVFPYTVLEAFAAGVPCVVLDAPFFGELIDDIRAFVFPAKSDDVDGFAAAVKDAIGFSNPPPSTSRLEELREEARAMLLGLRRQGKV